MLANRLKKILPNIISLNQSAFVRSRHITDNVFVAYDACMTLKLDMTKAYDRIEWGFPEASMIKLGFNSSWINKVLTHVQYVSFRVSINGKDGTNFVLERGLRQVDPLSSYLFLF